MRLQETEGKYRNFQGKYKAEHLQIISLNEKMSQDEILNQSTF